MRELESVVLTTDLAEYGLERGDVDDRAGSPRRQGL